MTLYSGCEHFRLTKLIRDPETGRVDPLPRCINCGADLEPNALDLALADQASLVPPGLLAHL